jgi:hypothetical protein
MPANKFSNSNKITDADIDDLLRIIQDIHSKHPHRIACEAISSHPVLERCRANLIVDYYSVVGEIKKYKKSISKEKRLDYLKRLLAPLKKLNRINPLGEDPYRNDDGTYPFIGEEIWLDKEIDITRCHYDKQKYSIESEDGKPLDYIETNERNIIIWDDYNKYLTKAKKGYAKRDAMRQAKGFTSPPPPISIHAINEGKTSVEELYGKWLPGLTQERIKSKDLLDQILVCYTIKRALNGDQKAIDKLYNLYKSRAVKLAEKMAEYKRLNKSEIDEIKQEANMILNSLISGLQPKDIINILSMEDSKHLKIPLWVENFFFWYYSDFVPKEIGKITKRSTGKLDGIEICYFLNPVSIIDAQTFWQNSPKLVRKFNSDSFRPNKKTNLTTWLFGVNSQPKKGITSGFLQGRFCQHIKEILEKDDKENKSVTREFQDDNEKDKRVPKTLIDDNTIEEARNNLTKRGFTTRNIEIVIQKLKRFSYAEIAKTNNLSRRQIIRICNKAKSLKPQPE